MALLEDTIARIHPLDRTAMAAAETHQGRLAIPAGSLGRLHDFSIRLAGITGSPRPCIDRLAVVTMAGDHGVADQGVSRFPQEVTMEMVANFLRGGAAINVLAKHFGLRLTVVDMGVAGSLPEIGPPCKDGGCFRSFRVAAGTRDFSIQPAMTRDQARTALENGIRVFELEKQAGLDAVGTGDMGIANTTPSAAIAAVILGMDPECVVNRGTGIDTAALKRKIELVRNAVARHRPDPNDPIDVLSKVGGFEIGGIAGLILGACATGTPVVIDGFISTAAALIASQLHPEVENYLFGGHQSAVEGHRAMLDRLGLRPMIDLGMRLGEGTGAAYGLSILSSAARLSADMLTFSEAAVTGPENA